MKNIIFIVSIVVFLASCKEKECYTCKVYSGSSKEFCGDNAKELGEIWLAQEQINAIANISRGAMSDERRKLEISRVSTNSKCTKN